MHGTNKPIKSLYPKKAVQSINTKDDLCLPKTRADFVYQILKDKIISGQIRPGTRIDQGSLSKEMGLSETPIREALRQLTSEGFIIYLPHIGAVVKKFTKREMEEFLEVRSILEIAATDKSIPLLTPEDLEGLRSLFAGMTKAANEGDYHQYISLNKKFHLLLVSRCRNSFLVDMVSNLWDRSEITQHVFENEPEMMLESNRYHSEILDAISSSKFSKARELVKQHKAKTYESYLLALED